MPPTIPPSRRRSPTPNGEPGSSSKRVKTERPATPPAASSAARDDSAPQAIAAPVAVNLRGTTLELPRDHVPPSVLAHLARTRSSYLDVSRADFDALLDVYRRRGISPRRDSKEVLSLQETAKYLQDAYVQFEIKQVLPLRQAAHAAKGTAAYPRHLEALAVKLEEVSRRENEPRDLILAEKKRARAAAWVAAHPAAQPQPQGPSDQATTMRDSASARPTATTAPSFAPAMPPHPEAQPTASSSRGGGQASNLASTVAQPDRATAVGQPQPVDAAAQPAGLAGKAVPQSELIALINNRRSFAHVPRIFFESLVVDDVAKFSPSIWGTASVEQIRALGLDVLAGFLKLGLIGDSRIPHMMLVRDAFLIKVANPQMVQRMPVQMFINAGAEVLGEMASEVIPAIPVTVYRSMRPAQAASLPLTHIARMTPEQAKALIENERKTLSPQQTKALLDRL